MYAMQINLMLQDFEKKCEMEVRVKNAVEIWVTVKKMNAYQNNISLELKSS